MQSISLEGMSRRRFLALAGAAPIAAGAAGLAERVGLGGEGLLAFAAGKVPVGLELYSVRDELKKDPMATVRSVAKMGYEVVEFFSPYYDWTPQQAADMRKLMDDVGVKCLSTHNSPVSFTPDGIQKAIDLNHALGSKLLVMASAGRITTADGWKAIADSLNTASDKLTAAGLSAGYHNHAGEWHEVEGKRPMDILAGGTQERVVLQLDVGTCVEAGADPVAWINAHPGRIKSMHCKEWGGTEKGGYAALFGEGLAPWPAIFKAAEATGGIECYLIEQEEGPADQQLERAERCLANFRKLKAS